MRPHLPLILAALAALPPCSAHADFQWGQSSREWDQVAFRDVNGATIKLWHHKDAQGSLYEFEALGDDRFQAKLTEYEWKPGRFVNLAAPSPIPTFTPAGMMYTEGVVTRPDTDYQAQGRETVPERDMWNLLPFGSKKTVLFPTKAKLQPTPLRMLKGPVTFSAQEKASLAKGNAAMPSADTCFQGGSSAAEAIANCFSPLELALGDGETLASAGGPKVSLMPSADDPVLNYYRTGDGDKIKDYLGLQRQSLARAAAAFLETLKKNASDSPESFTEGEDRLVIKLAMSEGQEGPFYAELRQSADAGKLADFVKKWRAKLVSTLETYVKNQGQHVTANAPTPQPRVQPHQPAPKAVTRPKATPKGPDQLTPDELKGLDKL